MSSTISSIRASEPARRRWLGAFVRRNPLVIIGAVVIAFWVIAAAFAPQLAPYQPLAQDVRNRLQPPTELHPWGTDELGRDVFSRVLYGGRITIPAGLLV
ncbi:MAG: hypothetical protein CUN53_07365, partial [Phototrophicales bacterium]